MTFRGSVKPIPRLLVFRPVISWFWLNECSAFLGNIFTDSQQHIRGNYGELTDTKPGGELFSDDHNSLGSRPLGVVR